MFSSTEYNKPAVKVSYTKCNLKKNFKQKARIQKGKKVRYALTTNIFKY